MQAKKKKNTKNKKSNAVLTYSSSSGVNLVILASIYRLVFPADIYISFFCRRIDVHFRAVLIWSF